MKYLVIVKTVAHDNRSLSRLFPCANVVGCFVEWSMLYWPLEGFRSVGTRDVVTSRGERNVKIVVCIVIGFHIVIDLHISELDYLVVFTFKIWISLRLNRKPLESTKQRIVIDWSYWTTENTKTISLTIYVSCPSKNKKSQSKIKIIDSRFRESVPGRHKLKCRMHNGTVGRAGRTMC